MSAFWASSSSSLMGRLSWKAEGDNGAAILEGNGNTEWVTGTQGRPDCASLSASSSLFHHHLHHHLHHRLHHHPCFNIIIPAACSQKSVSVNDYPIGSRIRDYWWQWKWRRRCQGKDHELIGEREISREWDVDQSVITDYPRHSFDPKFSSTCGYKRPSGNYPLPALILKQL